VLIQHSVIYFFSRALPGLVNLIALAIYTHLLGPDEYSRYALVIYGVGLANTLLYWWLRLSLIRFASRHIPSNASVFMATLLTGFGLASGVAALITFAAVQFIDDTHLRLIIIFSLLLLWAQAWYELNLELIRSRFSPTYYGVLSLARAVLALLIGASLAWAGYAAWGLLTGFFVSMLLPGIWEVLKSWRSLHLKECDYGLLRRFLSYGLPLIGVFGLEYVISSSDRFMLGWLVGTASTGTYSAAYDLINQSLIMLMNVIYLAGYPLIVKALESEGEQAARTLLTKHFTLLLMIGLPATILVSILASGISGTILGSDFQRDAAAIIPLVALGTLFSGLKVFYFDIGFQLANRTSRQLLVVAVPALLNVLLNLWWIQSMGVIGAALATFVAYLCALLLSWYLGRREYFMPVFSVDVGKVLLASAVMMSVTIAIVGRYDQSSFFKWGLMAVLMLGIYGILVVILNVCGARTWLMERLKASLQPR